MSTAAVGEPTIVLVHGACTSAGSWWRLEPLLEAAGYPTVAVSMPSSDPVDPVACDMYNDAAVVRAAVDAQERAIVICHSYGGMPTTQGVAGAENVLGLIYLSAFMPAEGESLDSLSYEHGVESDIDIDDGWTESEDGLTVLSPREDLTPASGTPDLRPRPQSTITFKQPATAAAWRTIPAAYIVCTDDRAIEPPRQRRMARHAQIVYEIASEHAAQQLHPEETADIVLTEIRRLTATA